MVDWSQGKGSHYILYPRRMVKIETRFCHADELDSVLAAINQEFIYSRGRTIEVQQRFPVLLREPRNILIRTVDGKLVSALALKRFIWRTPNERFSAAMIGLVWTNPSMRTRGHASAILKFTRSQLVQEQHDFAVLWTTQPKIYSGLGWIGADCGRYAVLPGISGDCQDDKINRASIERIRRIRNQWSPSRLCRENAVEPPLPLPATQLKLLLESDAYAVIGLAKDNAYIFDILGDSNSLKSLWDRISISGNHIHINVPDRSPADEFFKKNLHTTLPRKPLAMWLPISKSAECLDYASIYIPIFDRL